MRGIRILLVAAMVLVSGAANAGPAPRAAANQASKSAARAKVTKARSETKPRKAPRPEAKEQGVPTNALLTQYQRVGRNLILLQRERAAEVGVETRDVRNACADLQVEFRAIKLDDATKTAESRAETAQLLHDLQMKINRLSGVTITQECLDNPLAKDCL